MKRSLTRLAVMCALAACHSDSSGPSTPPPTDLGAIISVNAPSAHQQETTLAQAATGRIVAAWIGWRNDTSAVTLIEYAISDDRGVTWSTPRQIPIPSGVFGMSDPALAVDAAGNFALAGLTVGPTGVNVYRMPAGASSFGDAVSIATRTGTGASFDKTWIVPTASGLMATVTGIRGKDTLGVVYTSRDATTWESDTLPMRQQMYYNACADGDAASAVSMAVDGTVWSASSTDGGRTWAKPVVVGVGTALAGGFSVTVPSCIRRGQNEWVLIPKQGFTIALSRDGGASFATRSTLTTAANHAQLSVSPDESVDVIYYDARSNTVVSLMHARLSPTASTFATPEAIRSGLHFQSSNYQIDGIGDYVGLIPAFGTFTDNSSGRSRISFFRLR